MTNEREVINRTHCPNHKEFDYLCHYCFGSALVNLDIKVERQQKEIERLQQELHKELTEARRGVTNEEFDTEYNRVTVRGEIETLGNPHNPPSRADISRIIQGSTYAAPTGSDQSVVEREDSVGRRRRRQEYDSLGILHEEGGDHR